MDIRIGAVAPVGPLTEKSVTPPALIEAKVLAVRAPRRGRQGIPRGRADERRSDSPAQDPPGARVLLLMIPDGGSLPDDIQTGAYRAFVRFTRR